MKPQRFCAWEMECNSTPRVEKEKKIKIGDYIWPLEFKWIFIISWKKERKQRKKKISSGKTTPWHIWQIESTEDRR